MKILIIRHGIAENRESFARHGQSDARRPLTGQGRRRMRRSARGLYKLIPKITVLASSALTRAVETAEIVAKEYDGLKTVQIASLSPGKTPANLLPWVRQHPPDATLALVGHEPQLSVFASWMMTGLQESFIEMRKGGACLLELKEEVRAGRAKLLWLMKPGQLRELS